jgi:hypothetical protein
MTESRPDPRAEMRRLLIRLVVMIAVLDALAIGTYYLSREYLLVRNTRIAFTLVWTFLTLAIVLPHLWKIRRARDAVRRGRSTPRR